MVRRKQKDQHPLDALAEGEPLKVMALMLWKNRFREPDMYVQIDEKDIQGLEACVNYLKVVPVVSIHRPQGQGAQAAQPGSSTRRPVPALPAQPAKPFVIVTLVDKNGDMIKPVENNQGDFDAAEEATRVRKAKDQASDLAQRLRQQGRSGETSMSDMDDAADALVVMARAL